LLLILLALLAAPVHADTTATRDALDRLEEVLELRLDDGTLSLEDVTPAIIVSTMPRYEASVPWFTASVVEVLGRAFGSGLRLCEACMAPRAHVERGMLVYQTGPVGLDEIVRLDEQSRGSAPAARSAVWIDEHSDGVSVRIVELSTGRVLFAQNIDPDLAEFSRSERMYTLSEEMERRARGDSVTQAFVDLVLFPGQHISLDWTEQWGPDNRNLSGVTLSLFDPVIGLGGSHYRATRLLNTLVGGKLIVSLPTALIQSVSDDFGDGDILDPLLTAVGVVRVPFGRSNYGAIVSLSTNGEFGIGISLLNITLLPVLP
jgi:hypothetical protein